MWFSKQFEAEGKTALIVGASQGLGAVLAQKLYEKNCSVILVARREAKLKSQIEGINSVVKVSAQHTAKLSYIVCDAADYEACEAMWDELLNKRNQDPDFIFNCAGSSIPKLFTDLTKSDIKSGMPINYNTALYVIHTGVSAILNKTIEGEKPKRRTIVMFSSVASFFPFIGYSQYSPTKAAIQSLSIVLRQELRPHNFRVACVFPGNFMSEGFEEEQLTKPEITKQIEGPSVPISGEKCADIILTSLNRGYDTITTDFIGWFLGCSVLGFLPRHWSILQVFVSFILSIIAPIVNTFINRDIDKYFTRIKNDEPQQTPKNSTSSDSKASTSN